VRHRPSYLRDLRHNLRYSTLYYGYTPIYLDLEILDMEVSPGSLLRNTPEASASEIGASGTTTTTT
jgi:hypothetical protein